MADACTAGVSSASIMHEQQLMNLCLLTACVYVWIAQARAHSDSSRMQMSNLVIAKILVLRGCQQHFGCTSLPAPMPAPRTQLLFDLLSKVTVAGCASHPHGQLPFGSSEKYIT